jgi:hypothetical protein
MAVFDFTDRLRELEEKMKSVPQPPPRYRKTSSNRFFSGLVVEIFVNEKDDDDIYLSPGSCCELVGLSRWWLNGAYSRTGTMQKLVSHGMSPEKQFIDVLVPNSATKMTRPCLAIDRAGFDALLEYACELGKPKAIALRGTFMITGLLGVAGMTETSESYETHFKLAYEELLAEALGDA